MNDPTPSLVAGGHSWEQVSTGNDHVCALATGGTVYCWGDERSQMLGDGNPDLDPDPDPGKVAGIPTFLKVVAGSKFACGLTASKRLYCWGDDDQQQQGDGSADTAMEPVAKIVTGENDVVDFVLGERHGCALAVVSGATPTPTPTPFPLYKTFCWGRDNHQQLGDEDADTISDGVPTEIASRRTFAQISAYDDHTCGLTSENDVYCWGRDSDQQLGDGNADITADGSPGKVFGGVKFVSVHSGKRHTCGITLDKEAYFWGDDDSQQLGDGNANDTVDDFTPKLVVGGHRWSSIAPGNDYTCGITTQQDLHCWGLDDEGQLGDGDVDTISEATPFLVAGGLKWSKVSAGLDSACGLTTSGTVYCWGDDSKQELGNGNVDTIDNHTPGALAGGRTYSDVAVGDSFGCAIESTTNDTYCWGDDFYQTLADGNADTTPEHTPQIVTGGLKFISLSSGAHFMCGRTSDGDLYCWGRDDHQQLGDGDSDTTNESSPTLVIGGLDIRSATAGERHVCALVN